MGGLHWEDNDQGDEDCFDGHIKECSDSDVEEEKEEATANITNPIGLGGIRNEGLTLENLISHVTHLQKIPSLGESQGSDLKANANHKGKPKRGTRQGKMSVAFRRSLWFHWLKIQAIVTKTLAVLDRHFDIPHRDFNTKQKHVETTDKELLKVIAENPEWSTTLAVYKKKKNQKAGSGNF